MRLYQFLLKIFFLLFPSLVYSQKIEIVKDTVCFWEDCFDLQELTIINKPLIYKKIQKTYDIFSGQNDTIYTDYRARLKYKKKLIKEYEPKEDMWQEQYGFEEYEIYFNKNNLLNISISLQIFGSPYEAIQYFTFDVEKDEYIGNSLFKNKQKLTRICLKKLREAYSSTFSTEVDFSAEPKYLSDYQINIDKKGNMSNLEFVFNGSGHYRNKARYYITFSYNEIKPYIKRQYLKRL